MPRRPARAHTGRTALPYPACPHAADPGGRRRAGPYRGKKDSAAFLHGQRQDPAGEEGVPGRADTQETRRRRGMTRGRRPTRNLDAGISMAQVRGMAMQFVPGPDLPCTFMIRGSADHFCPGQAVGPAPLRNSGAGRCPQ